MSTTCSKDRSSLCSFTFADGRDRHSCHPKRSEGPAFRRRSGGLQTGQPDGRERPCVIPRAARDALFAVLVQTLHLAQDEYINAYGTDSWRKSIRTSHEQSANHMSLDPPSPDPPRRLLNRPQTQPQIPSRHRTHLQLPNRSEFIPTYSETVADQGRTDATKTVVFGGGAVFSI